MKRSYRQCSGFTLLETLVSVALTSVILVMLMMAMQRGVSGTARVQAAISSEEEGRIALQSVIGDLRNGTNWQQAYLQTTEDDEDEWGDDEVGFFLHITPEQQAEEPQPVGTLCFVHYYLAETFEFPNNRGRFTRILFRRVLNSAEVREAMSGGTVDDGGAIDSLLNRDPERDDMIAFDVVSFRVTGRSVIDDGSINEWAPPANIPREIGVELVIASEELATSLREQDDWDNSQRLGSPSQWPVPGLARYRGSVLLSRELEETES